MTPKRFLIVEDDKPTAEAIGLYLKSFFPTWEFSQSPTQKESLAKIEQEHPNVVILDIALPDGDGLDIVRQLAKSNAKDKPQFVVVTALAQKSYKAPRPGRPWLEQLEPEERKLVTALLHKPFSWKQFLTALAQAGQVDIPEGVADIDETI
jgi:CheY-like chemotaxis protein